MWDYLAQHLPSRDDFKPEDRLPVAPTSGLYLLLDNEEVVYVGHSANIRLRLNQHRREGRKQFTTTLFYPLEDHCQRLRLEAILILTLLPRENQVLYLGLGKGKVWEIAWPSSRPAKRRAAGGPSAGRRPRS